MSTLEKLEIAVEDANKLRELAIAGIAESGYNVALKHIENFVVAKSSYSIISRELLEFIRINKWQISQSQKSEEE